MATSTNFGFSNRKEGSRPARQTISKISISLSDIKQHFDTNIQDIQNRFSIADSLLGATPPNEAAAKDIWRSQIVFLDSALDFYMHEIIKYGIVKMFNGEWNQTDEYKKLRVSLQFAVTLANNPTKADNLTAEIDKMNQRVSFMSFDAIEEGLKLIGVSVTFSPADKSFLTKLYARRNQIVHQSDRIPANKTTTKQDITKNYIENMLNDMQAFVSVVHRAVATK